jgi:hypothetical protein
MIKPNDDTNQLRKVTAPAIMQNFARIAATTGVWKQAV